MWTKLLITVLDLLFNLNICPHTSTVINFWTRLVVSSWAAGVTTKPCPHRPCPKLSTLYMQRPLTIFFCYYFCRWRIDRLHHPIPTKRHPQSLLLLYPFRQSSPLPTMHTGAKASETDFNFFKVFWTKMVLYHSKSSDIDLFWP